MRIFLNGWIITGTAFGIWLFSLLFMDVFGSDPIIGNEGYVVRTIGVAILPILASGLLYGLELRSLPSLNRSRVGVHLTYLVIVGLLIPIMWTGMQGTLNADEPPDGFAVDLAALAALLFGVVIFWAFRLVEIVARKLRRKENVA